MSVQFFFGSDFGQYCPGKLSFAYNITLIFVFVLQVSAVPTHGSLYISKEKVQLGQTFTQLDIDRGFVSYVHDHSDTLIDSFGVAIFLEGEKSETFGDGRGQSGDVLLYEGLWNVTIKPINDRPFRLITGKKNIYSAYFLFRFMI